MRPVVLANLALHAFGDGIRVFKDALVILISALGFFDALSAYVLKILLGVLVTVGSTGSRCRGVLVTVGSTGSSGSGRVVDLDGHGSDHEECGDKCSHS